MHPRQFIPAWKARAAAEAAVAAPIAEPEAAAEPAPKPRRRKALVDELRDKTVH